MKHKKKKHTPIVEELIHINTISKHAKRVSYELNISYDIIENGVVYNVNNEHKLEKTRIERVVSKNIILKKGSIICLSPED